VNSVQYPPTGPMSALPRMLEFKVLVYLEGENDLYIAQCLNYDLVAEGATLLDVLNSLERIIKTQIKVSLVDGIDPFSDFEPAPQEFWARYQNSNREEKAFVFDVETSKPDSVKRSGVAMMKLAA
jgi:hypothetical protein